MEKFIVWDNKEKEFIVDKHEQYALTSNGTLVYDNYSFEKCNNNNERFKAFRSILKQDINGQEIYADCSIVEFELDKTFGEISKLQKGYFSYNNDYLCYDWVDLTNNRKVRLGLHFNQLKNIKIIDTIQENKLGLIK